MRTRFLAIAAPAALVEEFVRSRDWPASLPPRWTEALCVPGLLILAEDGGPALIFSRGAVLGTLRARADGQPIRQASRTLEEEIEWSRGQCLVDRHWGAWFAIFLDEEGHWAMRDPSSFAPAYHRASDGASVWFSDAATAAELLPEPARADHEFLRHWLAFPHLRTVRTGVEGTTELLPGTRRSISGRSDAIDITWNPWTFSSATEQIDDFEDAAARLRDEALNTVAAQARGRGELLLELSGGLDSSIIAASLKAGGVPFSTLNFVTRTAEGDERRWARAVADLTSNRHSEMEEIETPIELALPDRKRFRPGLSPVMAPLHRQFAARGRELRADTFLTGAGGDNVFCYLATAAPVLDAWRGLGPAAALGTTLHEVSEMCGCTAWTTARFALRKAKRGLGGGPSWRRDPDFLATEAAPATPEQHPWLRAPRGAAAGKREHIVALLRIQHVIDPDTRLATLPFLHPLIAQPLMELCLQIPTWLWVRGGHNRAVARRAFRGLLPDEVLDRRSKGRLEGMCLRAYLRHRPEIGELLLGGALREAGVLDSTALESYLEREATPTDALYFRLFELLSAELWLRSWR